MKKFLSVVTEKVEYLVETPPSDDEIKAALTQIALDGVA